PLTLPSRQLLPATPPLLDRGRHDHAPGGGDRDAGRGDVRGDGTRARGIPQRPAAQAHRGRHAARDELRRTLLVEPTYRPRWLLPGVVVGADESPFAAAARAVRHELGPSVEPGRLLVVDRVPPGPGRIEGLLLVYDGAPLPSEEEIAL